MKCIWSRIILNLIFCSMCFLVSDINAQVSKKLGQRYSRWTVEADIGLPFFVGNLTSFSQNETYVGFLYGARVGFQLDRTWGVGLSVTKGQNKAGARGYASGYLLGVDGMTYYLPQDIKTYSYQDIYSDIDYVSGGFYADINLNHLLRGASDHWCSVMLIPGIYVHRFSSVVNRKEDHLPLFPRRTALSWGAGIDAALRFRVTRLFDLQVRTGVTWITDNNFVGFCTPILARYNYMWNSVFGIIFKVPERGKRGNVMYAPRNGECYWE